METNTLLVSNISGGAANEDQDLVNPFDLLVSRKYILVTSTTKSMVIKYKKNGSRISSVSIPSPTGLCKCKKECNKKVIYVASEDGTIYSYPDMTPFISPGGMLGGLAWHKDKLYVAAFTAGYVKVYSGTTEVQGIADNALFSFGYKPYGIRTLENKIFITYMRQITKLGYGYVNVYNPHCSSLERIINRSNLSMPYGLEIIDGCELLVSNFGTGKISVFNSDHQFIRDIIQVNDGIMGISYNNGVLYFVAANDGGAMGSMGFISM